jgi:hypothetical protein
MTLVAPLIAVADLPDADRGDANQRLLWAGLALVAALLVGAILLAWLERWRRRLQAGTGLPGDDLAAYRLSYERGELSEDEFKRIRDRLTGRSAPPPPAPPTADQ